MLQMKAGKGAHFSHPPSPTSCCGAQVPGERRQGHHGPLQHSTGSPGKGAHGPFLKGGNELKKLRLEYKEVEGLPEGSGCGPGPM